MTKWFRADILLSLAGFIVIRMGLIDYHPGLYMTGVAIFICGFPLTEIQRLIKPSIKSDTIKLTAIIREEKE